MESPAKNTDPTRWLLWVRYPTSLPPPVCLMTAGTLEGAAKWREAHRWADAVPLVAFGGSEMLLGRAFRPPTAPDDGVPWCAENAPRAAWDEWSSGEPRSFGARMRVYVNFARRVAETISVGQVWIINGDADGGVLALAVAAARGRAVGLSATPPGLLAAWWARELDVAISERATQ